MNETSRGVLYCRYSSHAQREVSIEQQIHACRDFAERLGIEIVQVYEDHALSGTNDKRPAFQRMIAESASLEYQYVIVYSLDRFARDRYDSAVYKRQLKTNGKKVLSATENISDDPTGILLEAMLEALAEYYSKELAQKIKRGMEDNASRCQVTGSIPYGYRRGPDGRYELDPEQADVVREIYGRVLGGEKLIHVAEDLNRRGLRTKTGAKWGRSSFNVILHNERYTGVYIYQDKRIEGGVPQIIDRETFDAVQHVLHTKRNPRKAKDSPTRRRVNEIYLLTGKLYCKPCGSPLVGISGTSKSGRQYHYYVCKGHREGSACDLKPVRRDEVELAIAQAIRDKMLTPDVIEKIADLTVASFEEERDGFVPLENLREELRSVQGAVKNIVAAIEAGAASAALTGRLAALEERQKEIQDQIAFEELTVRDRPTRDDIIALLYLYKDGDVTNKDYQEALFDVFLVRAWVDGDKLRLLFSVFGDETETDVVIAESVRIDGIKGHHVVLYEHETEITMISPGLFLLCCQFRRK